MFVLLNITEYHFILKNSSCFRSFVCTALLVSGSVPMRTEAVSAKSLLLGAVGLTAMDVSSCGPITGLAFYGAAKLTGWLLGGAAVTTVLATGATVVTGAVMGTATAGTVAIGTVAAGLMAYGAAVESLAGTIGWAASWIPLLP